MFPKKQCSAVHFGMPFHEEPLIPVSTLTEKQLLTKLVPSTISYYFLKDRAEGRGYVRFKYILLHAGTSKATLSPEFKLMSKEFHFPASFSPHWNRLLMCITITVICNVTPCSLVDRHKCFVRNMPAFISYSAVGRNKHVLQGRNLS
jgi:hypothetical protein